jgi:hypothetical protein
MIGMTTEFAPPAINATTCTMNKMRPTTYM